MRTGNLNHATGSQDGANATPQNPEWLQTCSTHPSDTDHDISGVQISVHKVVCQQHLEVCVYPKGDNLGVERAGLSDVLRHTLTCT